MTKPKPKRSFTPEELAILDDTRDVKSMSTEDLKKALNVYLTWKMWSGSRYYAIDRELQDRATRAWVHDDIFGNTFAPLNESQGRK